MSDAPDDESEPSARKAADAAPADDWRRLPFTRAYPRDPELDALVAAFEKGNYAKVRAEAPLLAKRATDAEVARAARDLRARIEPDPLASYLIAGTGLLLAFLVAWFYTHQHPR